VDAATWNGVMNSDVQWMQEAIHLAQEAGNRGEVPVGALVVKDGLVIGRGWNRPVGSKDPTAHAELMALRDAAQNLGNYRLENCTLYVTLEPCTMCSGAIFNARIQRLVYGAAESKTGAAGSVIDVFANPILNHHTEVKRGILADECRDLMQQFFKPKRINQNPLRDDALRPLDEWFEALPGYPWQAHYVSDLPTLNGLRLQYLDENKSVEEGQQLTYLCLHGNPAWSYLYRKMLPIFTKHGHRVVAPDLIGFGKSDKLKKAHAHHFEFHRQVLLELIERLDLRNIVLVVQDWGGILGLTLPMAMPNRFVGLLVMNTSLCTGEAPLSDGFVSWRAWCKANPDFDVGKLFARGNKQMSPEETHAYNRPFTEKGHRAALHAFPPMVPEHVDSAGADISRQAANFWRHDWQGQSLMAIGLQDPVLGESVMRALQKNIRNCPEPLLLKEAGHFVQEHGQSIAEAAVQLFKVNKT
jgi:tRNA(adenine34) deaminase